MCQGNESTVDSDHLLIVAFPPSVGADVGSWREGGGRNLNTAPSPSEMDSKPPEEGVVGVVGRTTPSPTVDSDEANKPASGEGRNKWDRMPAPAPQQKLNGGQQPPGGVPPQFHAQFRGMMPPYVSATIHANVQGHYVLRELFASRLNDCFIVVGNKHHLAVLFFLQMFHAYPQMPFAPVQANFRFPVQQDGSKWVFCALLFSLTFCVVPRHRM